MRKLRDNKGSAVVETILLTPILVYLFFFTVVQLLSFVYNGIAYENAKVYITEFETSRTLEEGLNKLAFNQADNDLEIITITIQEKENTEATITLEFSEDTKENVTSFKDYTTVEYETNEKGEKVVKSAKFNYETYKINNANILETANMKWKRGNIITIETRQNVLGSIGEFANFELKVGSEKPLKIHIFPNDTIIVKNTGIIESELGGVQ